MASTPKVKNITPSDATLLTVFPYEWVVKDEYTDVGHIAIHVWCLDRDSKPYFLRIEDSPTTCYVELPTIVYGRPFRWNRISAQKVVEYLNFRLKDHAPIGHSLTFRKKIYYYFGEGDYPMLQLQFKSIQALNHCENLLKYPLKTREYGTLRCHVWESKIPIVRKLLTRQNMSFSQWFTVHGDYVEESMRISTMDHEYVVDSRTMEPIPQEVCDGWRVYPRILAFDIECYSDNKRIFPNAWHAAHVAYMISCIYQVYNHRSTRKRYAIILGPCAEIPSSRLESTEIIHVTTEYELVEAFGALVLKTDPEIVTGYNIFGFDYKYLHERLTQKMYEWPMMGRLPDGKTVMNSNEWSSGAYGLNIIYDLKMDGRINIDLLPIIRRDYKLLKYTLDFVANYFLGTNKHDITAPDMFWIYEQLKESERDFKTLRTPETTPELDEIVQTLEKLFEGCLTQTKTDVFDLYNKRELLWLRYQTFLMFVQFGTPLSEEEDPEKLCSFVKFIDVFNVLAEHNAFFKKHNIDIAIVLRYVLANILMTFVLLYCIQDSELVLDLMEELNIFLGLTQMSSVCGVTIVELFTRGQQIRCVSLLYDIATHQNFVIDQVAKSGYHYTGGSVYPPVPGLHDNVLCWDFASLYPTIIMAQNIDYTTLVHKSIEHLVPDELCNIIIFEQEEAVVIEPLKEGDKPRTEIVTKQYRFKFLNAEKTGHKGLLPQLEEKMVFERRAVRAKGKIEKDPIMREVYEQRQKALKVVCNSFYGFLGVRNGGKMPLMEAAMCVTGKARESILKVSTYIENTYGGTVIYGDTDSVMATLNITDPLEAIRMGKKLEKELTALFPPPMEMELEKVMRMLSLKKKRYVYAELDWDTGELKLDTRDLHFKGVELARRDRPKWLTDLQLQVLIKIMHLRPFEEALDVVFEAIDKLLAGEVSYTELITVNGLGASYKLKSAKMAVFAEDLKKLGKPAHPGSRLEYLMVEGDKNELQGHKMRLPETYLERLGTENEEKLDYMFYIKKLQNPIGQLLTVAYKDVIKKLTGEYFGIYARATTRHKYVGFNDPILLIYSAIMANNDHHFIKEAVKYKLHDEKRLYKGPTLIITPLEHIDSIHGE